MLSDQGAPLAFESEGEVQPASAASVSSQGQSSRSHRPASGWAVGDIEWACVFKAQHYGCAILTVAVLIALIVVHWTLKPTTRTFFVYDASISYTSQGDTIPAWATVVAPICCFFVSLATFELYIYRSYNKHITNAVATVVHFIADCVYAFVAVEFITELTKFLAGALRPNFLQMCMPQPALSSSGVIRLGSAAANGFACASGNLDGHKSFPSGHASVTCSIMVYHMVYLLWAGYNRSEGRNCMGLSRQTGWHGGRRVCHEFGQAIYMLWILCQLAYIWAVGVSRFNDHKHHLADVLGGWILGAVIALIYSNRAISLHRHVVMHNNNKPRGHHEDLVESAV